MKKHQKPKVSVVMATCNRAHMLPYAIESIQNQTLEDWELIIVDDASTDETPTIIQNVMRYDSRIRFYRHKKNRGAALSRNTAISLAQGRFIACQDDDDLSLPTRLAVQSDYLDNNPNIDIVNLWHRDFNDQGFIPIPKKRKLFTITPKTKRDMYKNMKMPPIVPASLMLRKHVYDHVPYRPFFQIAEDYDLILRAIDFGYTIETIPQTLYHVRSALGNYQTLSQSQNQTILLWRYYSLAWIACYSRQKKDVDPIDAFPPTTKPQQVLDQFEQGSYPFSKLTRREKKRLVLAITRLCCRQSLRNGTLRHFQEALAITLKMGNRFILSRYAPRILLRCLKQKKGAYALSFIKAFVKT